MNTEAVIAEVRRRYPYMTGPSARVAVAVAVFATTHGRAPSDAEVLEAIARDGSVTRDTDPEWLELVRAYRRCAAKRPKQIDVAHELGYETEQPVRDRLRRLSIADWREVHALIARS